MVSENSLGIQTFSQCDNFEDIIIVKIIIIIIIISSIIIIIIVT